MQHLCVNPFQTIRNIMIKRFASQGIVTLITIALIHITAKRIDVLKIKKIGNVQKIQVTNFIFQN